MKTFRQKSVSSGLIFALLTLVLFVFLNVPNLAYAQNPTSTFMDVCDDKPDLKTGVIQDPCGFDDLVELAEKILKFMIIIAIPLAALSFIWAGAIYITAEGSQSKIEKAHGIFKKTLIGFIFVLAAWVIVYTIGKALLDPGSTFFQILINTQP
ncbi:MAG: hypothetical protein A2653_02905 [Candidatus Zambryskibacteria bacterium RIFCSPHIGHO2_01_FULL_43_25]|uniref:Uncharacterized protein n=1 Tax=Candidatus Zambryskibacteria bacterium RIFCSPLOWO2_01_FULL_45_21 TaxID=1802761 RepID=A0A1G2U093_9BACT|nr:MAG: hypothetical protein A2653_02905 [Candidatus Zambryskibacteria bacterium RIFCSPHIGHO2_01_FULL_43_25]OHB00929.1 MAG: hypothetical protein A3E94_00105 [Candidatus Zambryskibacteria bacterium RIFCSPHIGHO2_12_FULL_44_12b]OHB02957.1 MAG: hypothetical protein A3B14_00750 [Candidatus Zambryskibacteria bacterium RIFCSPLOWO2_01_FULL_45_21]